MDRACGAPNLCDGDRAEENQVARVSGPLRHRTRWSAQPPCKCRTP